MQSSCLGPISSGVCEPRHAPDLPATEFTNDFDSMVIWQARTAGLARPLAGADRRVDVVIPDRAAIVQYEPELATNA